MYMYTSTNLPSRPLFVVNPMYTYIYIYTYVGLTPNPIFVVNPLQVTPNNTREDQAGVDVDALPPSAFRPTPLTYKGAAGHANTYVDKVLLSGNKNDTHLIKLRVRSTRRPELGDKFSSRHGQSRAPHPININIHIYSSSCACDRPGGQGWETSSRCDTDKVGRLTL